jgi:hypothetical protein
MAGAAAYMAGTPAPAAPALLLVPLLLSRYFSSRYFSSRYFSSRGWPAARAWNGRPSLGNRRAAERGGVPQRAT